MRQIVIGLVLVLACGGEEGGGTDIQSSGPQGGFTGVAASFFTTDAFLVLGSLSEGIPVTTWSIVISEDGGYCAHVAARVWQRNAKHLTLDLTRARGDLLAPGTYFPALAQPIPNSTSASLYTVDSTCEGGSAWSAVSGSISLSSVSADAIEGSVDLTLSDGTVVRGTLVAQRCNATLPGFAPGLDGGYTSVPPFECGE